MITGFNQVTLLGTVSAGPWHNPASDGRAESAAFGLAIAEPSRSGEVYTTYIRVECFGAAVPTALNLSQGDVVLCSGKVSWQRGEGKGEGKMVVAAFRIQPIAVQQA